MNYLYNHNSAETAYIVNDYPYGFRLRTQIRYWIETTKYGDRFVAQTLNPKTNRWNKEKKGTYYEVMVMTQKENGYISYVAFTHWEDEEKLNQWLADKDTTTFNPLQLQQIKKLRAIFRTRNYVTVEIRRTEWRNKETGEIVNTIPLLQANQYEKVTDEEYDKEQERIKSSMHKIYAHELSKL